MSKSIVATALTGIVFAVASQAVLASPDWSKVPKRDIHVFHAGVTPIEWVTKKSDHSGSAGMRKGETCAGCHEEKGTLNFDFKRLAGKELEPEGAPKTMTFPVSVQAAYDKDNLYIRLSFKAPSGGADKGDKDKRSQGHRAVRRCQGAAGRSIRLLGSPVTATRAPCRVPTTRRPSTPRKAAYELMQWASKGGKVVGRQCFHGAQDERRHGRRQGRGRQERRHLHRDLHPQESWRRQGSSLRRRDSCRQCLTVASITFRSATRWALVPMAT